MKKVIVTFCFIIIVLIAQANQLTIINSNETANPKYELIENSNQSISFILKINSYSLNSSNELKNAVSILTKGAFPILSKGNPELPKFSKSLIIPDNNRMELHIEPGNFIEIKDILITPSKGIIKRNENPSDIPFLWNESYNTDDFYPKKLAELNTPYVFRDYRGQTVDIFPFQYNPVKKILRIYTDIKVNLKNTGEPGENQKEANLIENVSSEFKALYQQQFLNYNNKLKYAPVSDNGGMLIVAHDDFYEQTKELLSWKKQRGLDVTLFKYSEVGGTRTKLKAFVEDYYYQNNISYLLLVGDGEHIEPLYKSGDSDAAYGHIEGDDSYAEVIVGRLSAQSEQDLAMQIQKTIYYERDMDSSHDWLNQAIGIASNEGGVGVGDNNETDKEHMNLIREDLLAYGYSKVDQIYDPGASSEDVIASINEGRSLINYVGHGTNTELVTSNFNPASIAKLQNYNKYPYVFDVACINGNFKSITCFAEYFMRAAKDTTPTGAVAIIASTINQDWAPPMNAQDEMVDILTESYENNIRRSFGGITINGCMFMNDNYGVSGSNMTNTWTIFGDPSLMVRTKTPELISAEYSNYILAGLAEYKVNSTNEGATVVVTANNNVISKSTVANGIANLTIPNNISKGKAVLTITGYNLVTLIDTLNIVAPEGPYLVIDNIVVNDSEYGNGNGKADYGEHISLNFKIKNIGTEKASNYTASLIDQNNYVELQSNCINQPVVDLDTLETYVVNTGFKFILSDTVNNNQKLEFGFEFMHEGGNKIDHTFSIYAQAPDLNILDYSIIELSDSSDQRYDAGEEIEITFPVVNKGLSIARDVDFAFNAPTPYLNVINTRSVTDTVAVGDTVQVVYTIKIHEAAPSGEHVDLILKAISGREYLNNQEFVIGQKPVVLLGEGEEEISKYPFNNFYQANKTQMIFTADEIGGGEKTMNGLSFFITRIPEAEEKRLLSNLKIKIAYTEINNHSSEYASMAGSLIVFENDFQMPATVGEVFIEFTESFIYNGVSNLIVELSWGKNNYFENTNSFLAVATETENASVAYGYQDNTNYPKYIGNSNLRPNIKFQFDSSESELFSSVFKVINSNTNTFCSNAEISIGGLQLITDEFGEANITLSEGSYNVIVNYNSSTYETTINVSSQNQVFEIDLAVLPVDNELLSSFKLYPNPVKGILNVELPFSNAKIQVIDMKGKVIESRQLANKKENIETGNIPEGVYLIKIIHKDFSINKKVVVVN